ncbi:MAG: hypothetical protein IJS60_03340 [Abditibacteriota bacterium]|nr:hypothetical protein [Abditibacteriota bacterium]
MSFFVTILLITLTFFSSSILYSQNMNVEINNLTYNIIETKSFKYNKIIFKDTGFEIFVTPNIKNGYKSYNLRVINTDQDKDKSAIISIIYQTKGDHLTWYYDVNAQTDCEIGNTYFEQDYKHPANPDFEFSSWPTFINGRRETPLPIGVISSKNKSLIMGYFLDEPRVYRIKYTQNQNQGEMRFEVDLGFSSFTKEPNVADFTFFIEEKPTPTTFREALKEYYNKCPQYFEDKNFLGSGREHGQWTLWMQKNVFAPWDFQIGYNQIQGNREELENEGLGKWQEPVLSYTEPWGIYQLFPANDGFKREYQAFCYNPINTQDMLKVIKNHADAESSLIDPYIYNVSESEAGKCALDTSVYRNPLGDLCSYHWFECYNLRDKEEWGEPLQYSMVIVNSNPALPHPNRFDLSMKECDIKGFDGYQLDSLNEFCGQHVDNYRKEHWRYEDIPLCYGADTKLPCQSHIFENIQYLRALREKADKNGMSIIASNTWHPCITFSAPFLDGIGAGEGEVNFNIDDRWFMLIRQLVPYKIISYLDYSFMTGDNQDLIMILNRYTGGNKTTSDFSLSEIKMERLLFFGIWPGTGNGWNDPNLVEGIRPLYQKYMPLFREISQAGYEPVQNAESDNEYCKIERYGTLSKGTLLYTIRNYKNNSESYEIKLIDYPKDIVLYNLKTLKPINYSIKGNDIIFNLTLKGLETGVVRVFNKSDLYDYKLKMAKKQINNLYKLVLQDNFWSGEEDNVKIRNMVKK